jgi:multimeric flavodoxin WrbA
MRRRLMNALILDGSPQTDVFSPRIYDALIDELNEVNCLADTFLLRDVKVAACLGCFGCWVKTPGICVIDDSGRKIAEAAIRSDLLILITPVTFGGYSSELKKAMDRLIPLLSPFFQKIDGEVHHRPRYAAYPRLAAVGTLGRHDVESERIFRTLVARNAINLHSPAQAAGVLFTDQDEGEVRGTVREIFSLLGVVR